MKGSVPKVEAAGASGAAPGTHAVCRVTPDLFQSAAARLVSQKEGDTEQAAKRLVATAPAHGIDLSLAYATIEHGAGPGQRWVRQVCLAVPGPGRTGMVFLSEPPRRGDPDGPERACQERVRCIDALCAALVHERSGDVRIVQALPEPKEDWAEAAYKRAGFVWVGDLVYMRRPISEKLPGGGERGLGWPPGVEVRSVAELGPGGMGAVRAALERSYVDTLDCPELCGMRETDDVLASHRATGQYNAELWWVVFASGTPNGCLLLSRCPEQRTVELVYLGLSPELRGKGIGTRLLAKGLDRVRGTASSFAMTCAVDVRNAPARKLYESLGFRAFAERRALVRPLAPGASRGA